MKNLTFTGKLIHHERRNHSINGNPKYYGVFINEDGETFAGVTATDSSCAYGFLNYQDKIRTVTYHITKGGKVVIDRVKIED